VEAALTGEKTTADALSEAQAAALLAYTQAQAQ
jgi:hypothetical protein